MSHYKEFKMGLIDEDEFRMACQMEFAGEEDERNGDEIGKNGQQLDFQFCDIGEHFVQLPHDGGDGESREIHRQ